MKRILCAALLLAAVPARAQYVCGPGMHFELVKDEPTCVTDQPIAEIRARLERIEAMLKAICQHSRHANGLVTKDDCPP